MAVGDRLRAARETYAQLAEAVKALEDVQQATLDSQRKTATQLAEFQKQVAATVQPILAECDRLRAEVAALQAAARYVSAALRRPVWWAFLLICLGAFVGSALHRLAAACANIILHAILGP